MLIDMSSGGLQIEGTRDELDTFARTLTEAAVFGQSGFCIPTLEAVALVTVRCVEEEAAR